MLTSGNLVNKTASHAVASKTCSFQDLCATLFVLNFDSLLVGSEGSVHL
jgi:hypothetical protein